MRPFFLLLVFPFVFHPLSNFVWAEVTVEFSADVELALGAPTGEDEIQRMVNEGLKNMGRTNAGALALYNSGQTVKLICFGSDKAKELKIERPKVVLVGPPTWAVTVGDFSADGTPKVDGTAYVVIDCDRLRMGRWFTNFTFAKVTQSMWDILVHELLHATHRDRRHPPDTLDMYQDWVTAFNQSIRRLLRQTKRIDRERGYFRLPDEWMEQFKAALAEELRKNQARSGGASSSSNGTSSGSSGLSSGSKGTPSTRPSGQGTSGGSGSPGGQGTPKSSSSSGARRTSQSSTIRGAAETKSGVALASSQNNLPTVVTGFSANPFLNPDYFLGLDTSSNAVSRWNPGDSQPGFVGEGLMNFEDLQVTIEVRFITVTDKFFERIGTDFDFQIDDSQQDSTMPQGANDSATSSTRNSGVDTQFVAIDRSFFERIGVDFDFEGSKQQSGNNSQVGVSVGENLNDGKIYNLLEEYPYLFSVGYGYDIGQVSIPFTTILGRQQITLDPVVVNDNPSKIFGLNSGVSPWKIVEDTQGAGLPLGGWTHASMPWGTTLGWQPEGNANILDAFTQEFGNVIQYEEPNAGISGAPAPLNPEDWPQGPCMPVAHMKIRKVW